MINYESKQIMDTTDQINNTSSLNTKLSRI